MCGVGAGKEAPTCSRMRSPSRLALARVTSSSHWAAAAPHPAAAAAAAAAPAVLTSPPLPPSSPSTVRGDAPALSTLPVGERCRRGAGGAVAGEAPRASNAAWAAAASPGDCAAITAGGRGGRTPVTRPVYASRGGEQHTLPAPSAARASCAGLGTASPSSWWGSSQRVDGRRVLAAVGGGTCRAAATRPCEMASRAESERPEAANAATPELYKTPGGQTRGGGAAAEVSVRSGDGERDVVGGRPSGGGDAVRDESASRGLDRSVVAAEAAMGVVAGLAVADVRCVGNSARAAVAGREAAAGALPTSPTQGALATERVKSVGTGGDGCGGTEITGGDGDRMVLSGPPSSPPLPPALPPPRRSPASCLT